MVDGWWVDKLHEEIRATFVVYRETRRGRRSLPIAAASGRQEVAVD